MVGILITANLKVQNPVVCQKGSEEYIRSSPIEQRDTIVAMRATIHNPTVILVTRYDGRAGGGVRPVSVSPARM
jgi:hypothetical protein